MNESLQSDFIQNIKPLSLAESMQAARETRYLEIGEGVLEKAPRVFRELFGDRPAVIVADTNTMTAAGYAVMDAFRGVGHRLLDPFIFRHPDMHAEYPFVVELESSFRRHEAIPVAVGSGTINDLTKLASHRTGRLYMSVATAASMDGYTAFGASITYEGNKQTFSCPAPAAVLADLTIIRAAPAPMSSWGYADLLAKVPAGADWILADALGVDPIHPLAWAIVQGRLREAVGDPAGVRAGQREALSRFMEGLMVGGFAMQATQTSRPASGAEHQFSHLWDMQHHTHNGVAPSHGLKVGIGTLAVSALYECLLSKPLQELDVESCVRRWPDESAWVQRVRQEFGEGELGTVALRETIAKCVSAEQLRQQLARLRDIWPQLVLRLRRQLLPVTTLRERLSVAGAAVDPEQIGISRERLRKSYWQAYLIRRRFTALDLAVRTGLLDSCLNHIFGPNGVWPAEKG